MKLKPRYAVIGLGVGIALVTAVSGVLDSFNAQHDDSLVQREAFQNMAPKYCDKIVTFGVSGRLNIAPELRK